MNNVPIILPRWCVLKYCSQRHTNLALIDSEFTEATCCTLRIVGLDIPVDDEMATMVMNYFESQTLPKSMTKGTFERFMKIHEFLTKD